MTVFLDSGGWLSVIIESDQYHEAGESYCEAFLAPHQISPAIWRRAEAIFLQYADARLSSTDCTSFALLEESPADEVFGFDGHFEMMGDTLQPKP